MMLPGFFQGQNSVCSQFNHVDAVQRSGAAHFVANRQHWLTAGAVIRRNERQAFRSKITGHTRLQIRLGYRKISIIQILDKLRILVISNVVDHDAANSLQSNKRESLAIDYAYGSGPLSSDRLSKEFSSLLPLKLSGIRLAVTRSNSLPLSKTRWPSALQILNERAP